MKRFTISESLSAVTHECCTIHLTCEPDMKRHAIHGTHLISIKRITLLSLDGFHTFLIPKSHDASTDKYHKQSMCKDVLSQGFQNFITHTKYAEEKRQDKHQEEKGNCRCIAG